MKSAEAQAGHGLAGVTCCVLPVSPWDVGKTLTAQNIKFEDAHVNFTGDIFYSEEKQHIALYFQHGLVFSQFPKFKSLKTLPATFFLIQQILDKIEVCSGLSVHCTLDLPVHKGPRCCFFWFSLWVLLICLLRFPQNFYSDF